MASLCRHSRMLNSVLRRSFSRALGGSGGRMVPTSPTRKPKTTTATSPLLLNDWTTALLPTATPVLSTPQGQPQRHFASAKPVAQKKTVTLHFKTGKQDKRTVQAKIGDNLLDVIVDNDVDIDGFGACEGTLACSTCHLIFTEQNYECIPEKPTDEELDMLDLAYGLQDTSRLGCQVIVTESMEGWEIQVPEGVSDAREP